VNRYHHPLATGPGWLSPGRHPRPQPARPSRWLSTNRAGLIALLLGTPAQAQLSPPNPDSDHDGRTDAQELAEGTDPKNPDDALPVRLGYWRFNTPDWRGEEGQLPLAFTNLLAEPSFDGRALAVRQTNGSAWLRYRETEQDGRPNFNWRAGSVRLLYRPNWSSRNPQATPAYAWGRGPGHWVRLFEAGQWTPDATAGYFALSIDPNGTNLVFQTQDHRGNSRTNLQARISWTYYQPELDPAAAPAWHEIVLTYTPSRCALIVDGLHLQDWSSQAYFGAGTGHVPPAQTRTRGFAVGSAASGDFAAEGLLDELETFNYPITPLRSYAYLNATAMSARVTTDPLAVQLDWLSARGTLNVVRRRLSPDSPWDVLATHHTALSYTDTSPSLVLGRTYEYDVSGRTLLVALRSAPVDQRGRVLLLVDETLAPALAPQLERLHRDLVGDGWQVARHQVPRHDDRAWDRAAINPAYKANVARIKALILAEYAAAPTATRAVFLVGHVAIPYSGVAYEDGHWALNGAWPADSYYGDVDGAWSDSAMNTGANLPNSVFRNVPGDGKWDPATFSQHIVSSNSAGVHGVELAVGRIDFANLPAFQPRSELDLLRLYLDKNHRYRHGQLAFAPYGVAAGYFFDPYNSDSKNVYDNANWTLSRLWGVRSDAVREGDCFAGPRRVLWGLQGGYGTVDQLNNSPDANRWLKIPARATADLARADPETGAAFYLLKGSYFGNWNLLENNFWRATLAPPNAGLAAVWSRDILWRFEAAAVGDTLGSGFVRTAQGHASTRTTAFLGDPTLRLHVTRPPSDLTARRLGRAVALAWRPALEPGTSYCVYRSRHGLAGPFDQLTAHPQHDTTFTDPTPPRGQKLYQVRASGLVTTGSGSFTNLSQGIFISVN